MKNVVWELNYLHVQAMATILLDTILCLVPKLLRGKDDRSQNILLVC